MSSPPLNAVPSPVLPQSHWQMELVIGATQGSAPGLVVVWGLRRGLGCCWCAGSSPGLGSGSPGVTSWQPSTGVHRGLALMALVHLSTAGGLRVPLQLLFSPLGVLCYPRGAGSPLCCLPWALHARRRLGSRGSAAWGRESRWKWAESPICAAFWSGFWVLGGHSVLPGALRGTRGQQGPAAAPLRGRTAGEGASARGWGIPKSCSGGASPNPALRGGASQPKSCSRCLPCISGDAQHQLGHPSPLFPGARSGACGACCGAGADPTAGLSISHLTVAVLRGSGGG